MSQQSVTIMPQRESKSENDANLLSRLTFSWLDGLLWNAFRTTLEADKLNTLDRRQESATLVPSFRATASASRSLVWRFYSFFKPKLLLQGVWACLTSIAVFIPPTLMRLILEYLEPHSEINRHSAWLCVGGLFVSGFLVSLADCHSNWIGRKISAEVRTLLMSEIYGKIMLKRLEHSGRSPSDHEGNVTDSAEEGVGDGNTLNLISVDVDVVSDTSASLYLTWVTFPVQLTLGTYLLYGVMGISGILGVATMVLLLPVNILVSKRMVSVQEKVLASSDARIQASNRLLQNIHTVKYWAWETAFREQILAKRGVEMEKIRLRCIWWSITSTLFDSLPSVMAIATCFFFTVVWGQDLQTSIIFPALAIFAILRIPLDRMADSINFILQAHVSILRIDKFLHQRETAKYVQLLASDSLDIGFDDATLTWPTRRAMSDLDDQTIPLMELPDFGSFQLRNLQVRFQQKALNVVFGESGSGKSSLLLGLLGEMDLIRGQVLIPNETNLNRSQTFSDSYSLATAYCAQEPWILNRSIRSNILLGSPFEKSRYEKVLGAVALFPDLTSLERGDQTLAGENGSRLSGGQKQRVALARALYSHAKCVLLDDCLSALDTNTAKHVFREAILGPLMQGRTCILATHNTQLALPLSQYIVMLHAGEVTAQGTYKKLVSQGVLDHIPLAHKTGVPYLSRAEISSRYNGSVETEIPKSTSSSSSLSSDDLGIGSEDLKTTSTKLYDETKSEGLVPWSVIKTYLSAMGPAWYPGIIVVGFAAQQVTAMSTNLWIREWAAQYDNLGAQPDITHSTEEAAGVSAWYYLAIYITIWISFAGITFLRDFSVFYGTLRASRRTYERLLDSILGARLHFYDLVPLGQITNRFSRDIEVLDQSLAGFSISGFQLLTSLVTVIVLISVFLPAFLMVAGVIASSYFCLTAIYIHGAQDLKRIEAVERSPLYQQFGEAVSGCVSIRAYALTAMLTAQSYELLDRLNRPYILLWASKEWLTFRVGVLSALTSFLSGVLILWKSESIGAGAAGLVLTYIASFSENVLWLVQVYALVQQDLNSVERIVEYTKIEQEAVLPLKIAHRGIPRDWPLQGVVRFCNYSTAYSPELRPSLNGITLEMGAGKRIALVGRTGAGKSTLSLALIRVLEATGGYIEIDDIDISSVSLTQLRQAITVVPQDPKVFDGNLRDNLAPFRESTDDAMLQALQTVHFLGAENSSSISPEELSRPADSLSLGQRQLLCIARGLLRRSRVLVLDEATASVDHDTDNTIQNSLRASAAAGTTILTIAHRITSIADYDRVLVLSDGCIIEQGSTEMLLSRKGPTAVFRQMCEESGELEKIEAAISRRNPLIS